MSCHRWSPRAAACVVMTVAVLCGVTRLATAEPAPGDITLKRTGDDGPQGHVATVFPHWRHRLFFTCNVCHPSLFPMKGGDTAITMDEIEEGKFCGTCHNGKIAWGVSITTCVRCHAEQ